MSTTQPTHRGFPGRTIAAATVAVACAVAALGGCAASPHSQGAVAFLSPSPSPSPSSEPYVLALLSETTREGPCTTFRALGPAAAPIVRAPDAEVLYYDQLIDLLGPPVAEVPGQHGSRVATWTGPYAAELEFNAFGIAGPQWHLARGTFTGPGWQTDRGIHVGSEESTARATYPEQSNRLPDAYGITRQCSVGVGTWGAELGLIFRGGRVAGLTVFSDSSGET